MQPTSKRARIGIDLGGTKTEVIALCPSGQTLLRKRVPTPSQHYPEIIRTIASLADEARALTGPVPYIGIGVPGAPDQASGRMKNANTTCLIGKALAEDLAQALACPVKLENDANCFTLSEAVDGAGRDYRVVFGVILGTGVGGGWVIDRKPHSGTHHIAGEWGHNPVPVRTISQKNQPDAVNTGHRPSQFERAIQGSLPGSPFVDLGRACYCGLSDCIETHLCGAGLARTHAWILANSTDDTDNSVVEQGQSGAQIALAAQAGDPLCIRTIELYSRQLASGLATIINMIDPDAIVLGGGVSNIDMLYERVQRALPDYVFNDRVHTRIVKAMHGDSSGVRGAAWL